MGFIDSAEPAGSDDTAPVETEGAATETPTDGGGQDDTPAQEQPQRTEKVVLSRRERSIGKQQAFEKQLTELKETFSKHGSDTAAAIAQRDAEIARLRGGFDVLAPLIARQQQAAAPAPPDPTAMMREAKKALDAGDFDLYQQKVMEATEARIFARLPPPQQQVQAQGTNPVVTAIMGQFPTVLNAGERGLQLAIIKDQELAVMGYPNGPDRYRKAFELASNMLQPAGAAQYSQTSREVLSGVPPARSGGGKGGNGEAGVHLSAYELSVAEKCGMTREEYAKYIVEADPKRLER